MADPEVIEEIEGDFSDSEDYVDDISDQELLADLLAKKPKQTDSYDSVILIDCIPVVGPDRKEKLGNVLRKIFSKWGTITTEHIATDIDGNTVGYMFLEYKSADEAKSAAKSLNGYKLDKSHTLIVNLFNDYSKYTKAKEHWVEPEVQRYKDPGNLQGWLLNNECLDQFSVVTDKGEKTVVFLNTPAEPSVVEARAQWTEQYTRWSPVGSYLCTLHAKGVAIWGGDKFKQIQRFAHPEVAMVDFSPCERYLVTFSQRPISRSEAGVAESVIIWDIATGAKKRGFAVDTTNGVSWPIIKWSHDGRYFGRIQPDAISVYEMPSCGLLDKKSIKVPGVKDFEWCPSANIISYWVPTSDALPARVVIMDIPSRTEMRVRTLYNVLNCNMHWQKSGEHVCVRVEFKSKTCSFEIFYVKKTNVPVDTVEVKEEIHAFAWEPVGRKFAFIHGKPKPYPNISFYELPKGGQKIVKLKTFENKKCNSLFWSPTGQFIVLAGLRSYQGSFEFLDTADMSITTPATEHFMASEIEWDPTGRYVATSVSWWASKMDNGFWLWNFQGRLIKKNQMDGFCQFQWRPRPPSLLNKENLKEIRKNVEKYTKVFELQDIKAQTKASKEVLDKRRRLYDDFNSYRQQAQMFWKQQTEERRALRKGADDSVDETTEETIEFLIKNDETVMN